MSNPSAIITARHQWRTMVVNGKEVPVEQSFTKLAWQSLGTLRHTDGKVYPKQGFVAISDVPTPPEAKTSTPVAPTATKVTPTVNVDEVESVLKSGEKDKLPVAVMLSYIKAKGITIENADKMPQHELFDKIKSAIA